MSNIARMMRMAAAGVPSGGGGGSWTDPDIANASYDSVSLDVSAQDATPTDIQFSQDGMKMFMYGATADDIFEYDLTIAFNISTASYSQSASAGISGQPFGMFFRADGLKVYVIITAAIIYQYSLSTAWDVSTLSYDNISFDAGTQVDSARDIEFKPDGTKMYISDASNDDIKEYDMSTAWNVSSASYVQNFSVSSQDGNPMGLYFNPTGEKFWMLGFSNSTVFEYELSTAWDLSSASYSNLSFSTSSHSANAGFTFAGTGEKMYISSLSSDTIYQYSTD
jgi:DNA-binding beta-propeller fold protein YncE